MGVKIPVERDLEVLVTSNGVQGNGMKHCQGRFRLSIRKRFFMRNVDGHCNRLPTEVITALSLLEFKKCLDNTLINMV